LATVVKFDISEWQKTYGDGTVYVLHQRNGDKQPYPCVSERDGDFVTWCIANSDVAVAGRGRIELQYYKDETLVKSETFTTVVERALGTPTEDAPPPYEGWLENILGVATEAQESAQEAAESAEAAEQSKVAAVNSAKVAANSAAAAVEAEANAKKSEADAEAAAKSAQSAADTSATNAQLSHDNMERAEAARDEAQADADRAEASVGKVSYIGANGNWYKWDAERGAFVDTGVAARGPKGDKGDKGDPGERGPVGPAGSGAGDMLESTYDPQGRATDIFAYVDEHIGSGGGSGGFIAVYNETTHAEVLEAWSGGQTVIAIENNDYEAKPYYLKDYWFESGKFEFLTPVDGNRCDKLVLNTSGWSKSSVIFAESYGAVTLHNSSEEAHADIREMVESASWAASDAMELAESKASVVFLNEYDYTTLYDVATAFGSGNVCYFVDEEGALYDLAHHEEGVSYVFVRVTVEKILYATCNEDGWSYSEEEFMPIDHSSRETTYGRGSVTHYGHVKLSDATSGTDDYYSGVAATPLAVKTAYDKAVAAQTAASNAQTTANGAASAASAAQTAANSKASTATYTVSVPTGWTANEAGGYYKTVTVSGMLATDNPIADVVLGADVDANVAYIEAWSLVTRISTAANSITLYANGDAPATAFTVQLKAVR